MASERNDSYVPIAIVGMSGCFPEAANVEEFWANLAAGQDSVKEISSLATRRVLQRRTRHLRDAAIANRAASSRK